MEWIQVFTIVVSVFGLFLWARRETSTEIREIRKDHKDFQKEMKELHNRASKIEERTARLEEKYQNFITSLFSNSSKEDLKQVAKETGIK